MTISKRNRRKQAFAANVAANRKVLNTFAWEGSEIRPGLIGRPNGGAAWKSLDAILDRAAGLSSRAALAAYHRAQDRLCGMFRRLDAGLPARAGCVRRD